MNEKEYVVVTVKPKILVGAEALMKFIRKADGSPILRPTLANLIAIGLPVAQINGTWYAHSENIEEWFRSVTRPARRRLNFSEEDLE